MLHGGNPASFLWRAAREKAKAEQSGSDGTPACSGRANAQPTFAAASPVEAAAAADQGLIPDPAGFQHFLDAPRTLDQCFTLNGKPLNPADATAWAQAEALMGKLAQLCMVAPAVPTPQENRSLPSGYTYLLQLVAHDVVQSSILLSRANDRLFAFANARDMPLRLETIYGGGPAQCPHVYQSDNILRHRLRLGRMRKAVMDNGQPVLVPDVLRDLARATPGTAADGTPPGYSEPCVADLRNDSHAIVSQLVTVFHILHNKICDTLTANKSLARLADPIANAERVFIAAQIACVLIFRAIVRQDLLPAILHRDVLTAYEGGMNPVNASTSATATDWRAPLELTHGAMRFAHAMARPTYSFNELTDFPTDPTGRDGKAFPIGAVLAQNSMHSLRRMPFERKWIVDWRRFFGSSAVNFAMLIGPLGNPGLELGIQQVDRSRLLIERDFLSSLAVQPLSVRTLIEALQREPQGRLIANSPFLKLNGPSGGDAVPGWFKPISDWLTAQNKRRGLLVSEAEIKTIALDPPIPFFVRFEADQDPAIQGKRLGLLGSIMLADVLYGIFRHDPIVSTEGTALQPKLRELAATLFQVSAPDKVFDFVGEPTTFEKLLVTLGDSIAFPAGE